VCCALIRLIQARYNSQLALTVSVKHHQVPLSSSQSNDTASPYAGAQLTLQRVKTTQFGRANQRWTYDQSTGIIAAFSTDTIDKGISASSLVLQAGTNSCRIGSLHFLAELAYW